jgi:hypothetical protein
MATCKQLFKDYNRLTQWLDTHQSIQNDPEYDGASKQQIAVTVAAIKQGCKWIGAITDRSRRKKTSARKSKKPGSRRRTKRP